LLAALTTHSFRNLADATWKPAAGRQLLLGPNGAGKTSVLEAVYLLATSRSFRTNDLAVCGRHGAPGFHLAADAGEEGATRLEIGWQPGKRRRQAGGQELPLGQHVTLQPVVLWTAGEADLLAGAPELGRRLIDRGLVSTTPGALGALGRYRQLIEQKRKLLASGRAGGLQSWNSLLAEAAAALIALRSRYVATLEAALGRVRSRTPLELPPVGLEYLPSPRAGREGAAAILAALERVEERERERGIPLVGPHRDDLRLLWGGREVRAVASAGEGKALGLLLAAAQGELVAATGREPLYLLDDADAELDRQRLAAVWQAFPRAAQVLATSSRTEAWEGIDAAARWEVGAGVLRALATPP
jgi:DNA replication and repair protein RecF